MKYIKELIENSTSLDHIKEKLSRHNGITVIDATILGVPSIIVTSKQKEETIESVYNNYDFIVISNRLDIITASPLKMIGTDSLYSSTDYNLKYNIKNMVIEEWLHGNYVVVANYNDDTMVSTKSNLYATNFIPGTTESYYNCLISKFEEYSPYGIEFLFSPKTKNYIWIFNITNNKEIYLLTAYDRESLKEIDKKELKMFISKFDIEMPKYEYINNNNVQETINKFTNTSLKGIIYNNIVTGYKETEKIKQNTNVHQCIYANSRNILYKITDLLIEDKIYTAKHIFNKYIDVIELLDLKFKKQYKLAESMFKIAKQLKTRKQIANNLKNFKYSPFIFDSVSLRDIDFKYFGEYYSSKKLLKLNYTNEEIDSIINLHIIPKIKE